VALLVGFGVMVGRLLETTGGESGLLGRRLAARLNAAAVRSLGTDLLTVRIDLDPVR